ncbi:MAG: hypothetical protein A3J67_04635 [Parcubacteria group bacterium RIFCSPHIGHO2_02_FULL_48_10b]|nr:MAG: hypothetical protein A3J67_04635 [Parcubacteria group bacterium RIFCSPHIGHO2_02_FULL_48_10b]
MKIEDYISGKSLIDEIEKLRNHCVAYVCALFSRLFFVLAPAQREFVFKETRTSTDVRLF